MFATFESNMKPFWGNEEAGERLKAQILYLNDILYLFCFKQIDSLFFLNECFQRLKSAHLNDVYFSWVEREFEAVIAFHFISAVLKKFLF